MVLSFRIRGCIIQHIHIVKLKVKREKVKRLLIVIAVKLNLL
ncbi:MAG: hypothetical protein JWP12_2250 [Bacteroidetes bacterium]|nr:hypothetical protein [Bacteroidota bacterium]